MSSTTPAYIAKARHITRAAEQQIRDKTGMKVTLVLCPGYNPAKTPEQMLQIVAGALNMDITSYKKKTRERDYVDLRFIAAFLLRSFFPGVTLQNITVFFGGQDHTSIINGLARAGMLIATGDARFTAKYEAALRSVNKWLRKEAALYNC